MSFTKNRQPDHSHVTHINTIVDFEKHYQIKSGKNTENALSPWM